jgi:galactokinase/mevalonate kinase-like predicted kinase
MRKLISLSPAVAKGFEKLTGKGAPEWFCTHDPIESRLGSGGGTVHLLREAWSADGSDASFEDWAAGEGGLIVHAGGQSRRLPAYAAEGKALIPVPVFRWSIGQRIDQTLLDLQVPFLERVLSNVESGKRWLIASGDVMLEADSLPVPMPEADVVCLGMWGEPEQATRHGVFFAPRSDEGELSFMLQKPDLEAIREHSHDHYFLLDVGVWLLTERAMRLIMDRSMKAGADGLISEFDLYSEFGPALGTEPHRKDTEINELSVAIVPLDNGRFYHFGSGHDLIDSCLRLQNRVSDQRRLSTLNIKPHPSMFVQNSEVAQGVLTPEQEAVWVDNSAISAGWKLNKRHILTGIPSNDWDLEVPEGICLDVAPMNDGTSAWRIYGIDDSFRGPAGDGKTVYCGGSLSDWLVERGLTLEALGIASDTDLQQAALFPVFDKLPVPAFIEWLMHGGDDPDFRDAYISAKRLSAEEISAGADLFAIRDARVRRLEDALPMLFKHAERSVAYQIDLEDLAGKCAQNDATFLDRLPVPQKEDLFAYIRHSMFVSRVKEHKGQPFETEYRESFSALAEAMVDRAKSEPVRPVLNCMDDQIFWGRSPARLDLAGGWADTPPYCFLKGGRVVNIAVELNGQPPIQAFVRKRPEGGIRIRSIDLGYAEEVFTYDDLRTYAELGSGFAVPKAALALCGFLPEFHAGRCPDTLAELLKGFGSGIEISLLCAIPKGSGLGTSSILSATLFGVLSEFCQLGWDQHTIAQRVLVLEQMLTSGGGWQDQYGGICRGLKYFETRPGLDQMPRIHWIDDHLFTDPAHKPNILLYYTGITRVAKNVLGEIVRGMFLNDHHRLEVLDKISEHAEHTRDVLQEGDYDALARAVARSWELNQSLDSGTNPPEVQALLEPIQKWIGGCKLLGAGGGGYMLILAKDGSGAQQIKKHLRDNPPNPRARFVDISVSKEGLQVTRS